MTPDEFVEAGDKLVALCGTWQWCAQCPTGVCWASTAAAAAAAMLWLRDCRVRWWCTRRESGEEAQRRDYLPPDKQFLVTKHGTRRTALPRRVSARAAAAYLRELLRSVCATVPCLQRVRSLESATEALSKMAEEDEDGWLATAPTGGGGAGGGAEEIGTMDDLEPEPEPAPAVPAPAVGSGDTYVTTDLSALAAAPAAGADDDEEGDLDDMEDWDVMEDDDATLQRPGAASDDHIERTRT